jgi:hypothetical protein
MIPTMNVVALISTILWLVLGSVALLFNTRRKRPQPVMMLVALLICGAGALLGEIERMTWVPGGVGLAMATVGFLLVSGGCVCVFVSNTRWARVRSGSHGSR